MEEYRVIRSARKTLSLEITEDLTVLVRAPYQVSQSRIEAFVAGQQDWITAHRERCRQWQEQHPEPTEEERLDLLAERYELTAREREIVALMREGRSNPEIGEALYVTRNTVKKHIQNIYEKLGVNSRKGLDELLEEQNHPPG